MKRFDGIYAALVTPFDHNGKIHADALQRLIDKLIGEGAAGFYVSGSTGESYLLSMEERKYLLDAASEAVGRRRDLIVNVGIIATEHGIELARHAERKDNVSAISAVPPFYFPFSKREILGYYHTLAHATSLPLIVYNIPAMSGIQFTFDDLSQLLSDDEICGIKHTSYDLFQLQRIIQHFPEKNIFIGHDELFLSALSIGAHAGIGSTFNIMADKFIRMQRLFEEKKMEEALAIQSQVNEVVAVLLKVGVFKGVKAILKMQGIDCGVCRAPFDPLSAEEEKMLTAAAEQNGLLG